MNKRGSILLQVLVTGVILAMISAAILRLTLGSSFLTARVNGEMVQKRADEGGLARLSAYWNANGLCTSNVTIGYSCSGTSGSCNCVCTPTNMSDPSVNVTWLGPPAAPVGPPFTAPGQCQVTVTAVDTVGLAASDQAASTY